MRLIAGLWTRPFSLTEDYLAGRNITSLRTIATPLDAPASSRGFRAGTARKFEEIRATGVPSYEPWMTRATATYWGPSGDGNQGGEMTVAVAQLEGLDPAGAGLDGVADRVRSSLRESGLAVLLPHPV
jgi:hypothetical protein